MKQKYLDSALLYLAKQKVWAIIGKNAETMKIGWEVSPDKSQWDITYNDKPLGAFVTKKALYEKAEQLEEGEETIMKLKKFIDETEAIKQDQYKGIPAPSAPPPQSDWNSWGGFDLSPKTQVQPKSLHHLYHEPKPCPKQEKLATERWAKLCAEYPTDPAIAQIPSPKAKASAKAPADPEPAIITSSTEGMKLYQWVKDDFVPYVPPPTKDDE